MALGKTSPSQGVVFRWFLSFSGHSAVTSGTVSHLRVMREAVESQMLPSRMGEQEGRKNLGPE